MDIKLQEYIQKCANRKFYISDESYQPYTAEILEMYDMPGMWSTWNHAVLCQNLNHNGVKLKFYVNQMIYTSIKFKITMNFKMFYLYFDTRGTFKQIIKTNKCFVYIALLLDHHFVHRNTSWYKAFFILLSST